MNDLNAKLFQKSTTLKKMNEIRVSLYFLNRYLSTCRFADENGLLFSNFISLGSYFNDFIF